MKIPDVNSMFPLKHYDKLCYLKNIIKNPNIKVGDYTYYDDFEDDDPISSWDELDIPSAGSQNDEEEG